VSVVIPTLNEEDNIGWVLSRLPRNMHEILLVDGRSHDHTVAVARRVRPDVRVLEQHVAGKGAALALGLTSATGDIVVMIDADGSMDPAEIPGLLGALLSGADVVKGSRESAGGGSHDLSLLRRTGSRALTVATNSLYRKHWRELCYGYAAFWADVIPMLDLVPLTKPVSTTALRKAAGLGYGHGFEIEALLFCRSARAELRVAEVFSFEHERRHGESHLATWRDGCRVLAAVLRERRWAPTLQLPARHLRAYPLTPYLHAAPSPTVESPAHCPGPAHRDVTETAFEPALPEDLVLIPLPADVASSGAAIRGSRLPILIEG
jgi:hypothetical protein